MLKEFAEHKFSLDSDAATHQKELLLISRMAQIDDFSEDYTARYELVLDSMKKNSYPVDTNVRSRLFEYSVVNKQTQLSNKLLKMLGGLAYQGDQPIEK